MLSALVYVHSLGIVHRDVKAENFLFKDKTATSNLKMIDFGMAAMLENPDEFLSDVCGSPHYLAPELVRKKYNAKADMWALGVLIFLMLYGKYPFDGNNTQEIVHEIMKKEIQWHKQRYKYSKEAVDFMKALLQRDPSKRLTAAEAIAHPWVAVSTPEKQQPVEAEAVRSAHRKVTMRREEKKVPKEVEERRNKLLQQLEDEFNKGIRRGRRIAKPVKLKPEFSRHDKRMSTTPSRMQQAQSGHVTWEAHLPTLAEETAADGEAQQQNLPDGFQDPTAYDAVGNDITMSTSRRGRRAHTTDPADHLPPADDDHGTAERESSGGGAGGGYGRPDRPDIEELRKSFQQLHEKMKDEKGGGE